MTVAHELMCCDCRQFETCPSGEEEAIDPVGLTVPLMTHQKQAIKWMTWREAQHPPEEYSVYSISSLDDYSQCFSDAEFAWRSISNWLAGSCGGLPANS